MLLATLLFLHILRKHALAEIDQKHMFFFFFLCFGTSWIYKAMCVSTTPVSKKCHVECVSRQFNNAMLHAFENMLFQAQGKIM